MSDAKHEHVLRQVFSHPTAHNLEWRDLIAALETVGTVEEMPNGKYHFSRSGRTLTLEEPRTKDADEQEILRLRRFMEETAESDQKPTDPRLAIIVVTHDDVSVYRGRGEAHQEFKPEDPHGFRRHLHHKGQEKDNPLQPEEDEYYAAVAGALIGVERIALISNAAGSSSSGGLFLREFSKRHQEIAGKIVSELTLDLEAMTEAQLTAAGLDSLTMK